MRRTTANIKKQLHSSFQTTHTSRSRLQQTFPEITKPNTSSPRVIVQHTRRLVPHTRKQLPQPKAPTQLQHPRLGFHSTVSPMSSDADYMAFLDKANEDPGKGYTKAQATSDKGVFKTRDDGAEVPRLISEALQDGDGDVVYVSEADEPFVAVALKWDDNQRRGLPDEVEFAKLIHHPDPEKADVEIMDPIDWDPDARYGDLIDAVMKATKGNDVRVYKVSVPGGGARTEYWVVSREGEGQEARLVGVKALAIES